MFDLKIAISNAMRCYYCSMQDYISAKYVKVETSLSSIIIYKKLFNLDELFNSLWVCFTLTQIYMYTGG